MEPAYIHTTKAWYADHISVLDANVVDEVMIGLYERGGGTEGEFAVKFHMLGHNDVVPRIEIFQDAWGLFTEFSELFQILANLDDQESPETTIRSGEQLIKILDDLGFKDHTSYSYDKEA